MNCSFVAWVGKPSSQPEKHFLYFKRFYYSVFFRFIYFFSQWAPESGVRVWEKLGTSWNEHSDKRVTARCWEVVKDICSWPQTPPAAAALIQALLQGLSQAPVLGIGRPTFCSSSAFASFPLSILKELDPPPPLLIRHYTFNFSQERSILTVLLTFSCYWSSYQTLFTVCVRALSHFCL